MGKNKTFPSIFFIATFFAVFFDQITKFFVVNLMKKFDGNIDIVSFFSLTLVKNKGIVFGLFSNEKTKIFIIFFSLIAIFFITFYVFKFENYRQFSLGLITGGIIGNLIDRIKYGYVIDFINFHFFPVFNFADTFVSIGIILFFLKYLRE
ncbi:MAG: signal peptidase II [Candidatus Omnitrophica bacterium]|nr:signal peptidase II [Candidatus Omnitrophota bacterium]MCM8809116.1 signal peptidase II [Candidatus Omnitrophota bacterium]MCM8811095.1 signal peptidase II [Candidatus Omnitrophota bacterium]MCM8833152.1 signal peptidase II [Candidatus Omnitrophota bacterium]